MRALMLSAVVTIPALLTGPPAHAQSTQAIVVPLFGEPVPGLRGFNVVLVQGDLKASATSDNVPAAAAKALADLKQFLPYKSYRLLDTQWAIGSGRMTSRLRGPENRDYDLELVTHKGSSPDAPVAVSRFWLRDSDPNAPTAGTLAQKLQDLNQKVQDLNKANAFPWALGARAMIDTSFSMSLGETVVVGTSR